MLVIVGEFLGVSSRRVEPRAGGKQFDPFDEVTATMLVGKNGTYSQEVQLAGKDIDREDLPARGEPVAFEVSIQSRVHNDRAYLTYKAWRRVPEVEALLSASRG